jgi:S1-C subfamily serine protease
LANLHKAWAKQGAASMEGKEKRRKIAGSGTGFFVSKLGHVITNNHVVDRCLSVTLRWSDGRSADARILAQSADDDLALLKTEQDAPAVASFRGSGPAKLGETVLVFGFPLPDLLASSGNLTTGTVTALAGLRDESRLLQLSAPVQAGNSGGPVLDSTGSVLGVVVSKIDAHAVASRTNDVPQNVNFAVKASVVQNFLEARGVEFQAAASAPAMSIDDLVAQAKLSTVQVNCMR